MQSIPEQIILWCLAIILILIVMFASTLIVAVILSKIDESAAADRDRKKG